MDAPETLPIRQASTIPYRRCGGELQFCLITSIRAGRWGFPKGIVDPGETVEQTVQKEALEEAGIHGRIVGDPLGTYQYRKWGTILEVIVLLMEVTKCDQQWQEADVRQRRWATPDEARYLLRSRPTLCRFLEAGLQRIGPGGRNASTDE